MGISKRGIRAPTKFREDLGCREDPPRNRLAGGQPGALLPRASLETRLKRMEFLVQGVQLLTSEMGGPAEKNKSLPH